MKTRRHFNPFKPNGISDYYQLDQFIFVWSVVGGIFHFYSNFKENFCKQTVENLIRRGVWSGFALFADVPQKGRQAYMGLTKHPVPFSKTI